MAYSLRTTLIAGSLVVSLGLVTTAFIISSKSAEVSAQNAEELLRAYASKDTDADGLPDWQEQLYNTDPENANSVDPSMTDGAAVAAGLVEPRFKATEPTFVDIESVPGTRADPDSVTDRFARAFFEQYLRMQATGEQPSTESLLAFIETAVDDLADSNSIPKRYDTKDVNVVGSGSGMFASYLTRLEAAFARDVGGPGQDAMYYVGKIVYENDTTAQRSLEELAKDYEAIAKALIRVSAPKELAATHLRLSNAVALMSTIINDLTAINDDPLRAFLVIGQYEYAAKELSESVLALDSIYTAAGVSIEAGQPGYTFYSMMRRVGDLAARNN